MANIKDLFEKNKDNKILADASLNKVGSGIESSNYVKSNIKNKERFIPRINFSSASNFARYGLAEKYYSDSINYITSEYPYDGSQKEKIEWNLSSSYLDRHIFENEYPRTTGYINLGLDYGTVTFGSSTNLDASTKSEYIGFLGNTTTLPQNIDPNQPLSLRFDNLNLYNTASAGFSNLEINGSTGFGAEFWLKKDGWGITTESREQIILDIWNSSSVSPIGLFRVSALSASAAFNVSILSGAVTNTFTLGSKLPISGNTWNHYALMFKNNDSNLVGKLYHNGNLVDIDRSLTSINKITGSMMGNIGATTGYGDGGDSGEVDGAGFGKLSASLDEFRFWKTERSAEKIGRHWFTQVGGGTNSDITRAVTASTKYSYENPVDLGFYYKFNEGIFNSTATVTKDSVILDYAGRVTNGNWTGYSVGGRSSGSAIVESSASLAEFKDPIIYSTHPDVVSLLKTKKEEGYQHDQKNLANIYSSYPNWILEEDEGEQTEVLKDLTQIIASYFDTLQLQIDSLPSLKDVNYFSGSDKPYPFAETFINSLGMVSSDIFSNATDLEYLASRNDYKNFSSKLEDTKNKIYQNIYNNLVHIYKSKGTEKSFRNLIRCFGVDDELVNINLYGDNIEYEFRNNVDYRIVKKRYANFYEDNKFSATVFQQTSSTNSESRGYLSSNPEVFYRGNTYEAEAIFGSNLDGVHKNYIYTPFTSSAVFGCHSAVTASWMGTTWGSPDYGNFQVLAVRPSISSKDARFHLTGTAGGFFPLLTSSLFRNVYDDSRWNFAVKVKPTKYPLADGVTGSATGSYDVEFSGYNYVLDSLANSFSASSVIDGADARQFLISNKRFFAGAHRTNFTGSVVQNSSAKISSVRAWIDYLDDKSIQAHAQDVENFGTKYPYKNAYISQLSKSLGNNIVSIPQMETLALSWNFDTVTSSNASGQFVVPDVSTRPINYIGGPGTLNSSDCITWENLVNMVAIGCGGIVKTSGGSGWNSWANAAPIGANGAVTFDPLFTYTSMWEVYGGLHTSAGSAGDQGLIAYAFFFDSLTANAVVIREAGSDPTGGLSWAFTNPTDRFRIIRGNFGEVFYQRSIDDGATYSTIYASTVNATGDLYPVVTSNDASWIAGLYGSVEQGVTSSLDWGWLSSIAQPQHTGMGYGFPVNDTGSIDRRYIHSAKQQLPEVVNSGDMVSIIDDTDNQMMTRDSRPIDYYFAFEKSMYGIISEQIINYFGTIVGFNNLIGEPVNRYRQEYKDLGKLRSLYFERVKNTPDFEKFVEYFKWIDTALGLMLVQLAPATAGFSEKLRTMVESHVLERNKYWTKFPSLEVEQSVPEAGVRGINEMLYSWKRGHAPFTQEDTQTACIEWKNPVNLRVFDYPGAWSAGCGGVYKGSGENAWNSWANAKGINTYSSVTFLSSYSDATTNSAKVGLHTSEGSAGDEPAFAFWFDANSANAVLIHENGSDPTGGSTWALNTTDYWRIKRSDGGTIEYQRSTDGGVTFSTVYTSATKDTSTLYPVIAVERVPSLAAGITSATVENRDNVNCLWWKERAEADNSLRGNSTVDTQRNTFRLANDFRSGSGPTLAVSRNSTDTKTTYAGSTYAIRNFTKPYRLMVEELPEIHGGSNFSRGKKLDYAHTQIKTDPFGATQIKLKLTASTIEEKACTDVIDPSAKKRLEGAFVSNQSTTALADVSKNYEGGRSSMFAPFSLFSSSITPSYLSNFRSNTQIANYHNDSYGEDNETPIQGPFTNAHVGGWQYRHQNINSGAADTTATRAEAWELSADSNYIQIASRNYDANLPRATMLRTDYAKRPVNIRNIKWGTGSQVAGNFRKNYEVLQTSKRALNNRFFVKNEGFNPVLNISPTFDEVVSFQLPRYDLTGTTKSIFVERFNAPGGPEVSSRGALDLYAEEYAIYNNLNFRNQIVRNALDGWQRAYCGQFGTWAVSGAVEGYRQPRTEDYNTLANYHKVNRNGRSTVLINDFSREVEWVNLGGTTPLGRTGCELSNFNRTLGVVAAGLPLVRWGSSAESNQSIETTGYFEIEVSVIDPMPNWVIGLSSNDKEISNKVDDFWDFSLRGSTQVRVFEGDIDRMSARSIAVGDKLRISRIRSQIIYQHKPVGTANWITFYISTITPKGNYYPRAAFDYLAGIDTSITNARISNPRYDNWYVQHPIPQSELQYAWINDSYDKSKDQPFGYASNFTVPSGSTATTASAVQFVTKSCWNYDWATLGGCSYYVNFAQYYFQFNWPKEYYKYTITPSTNTLEPGYIFSSHLYGRTINGHFNNINGPYGYPSWKQIRTGETPVARYQKNNNILSIMQPPRLTELPNGNGFEKAAVFYNSRTDTQKQFIVPPVVFKYRALDTEHAVSERRGRTGLTDLVRTKLRSTYANNNCLFSHGPVQTIGSNNESIADWLNVPSAKTDMQIYDVMKADPSVWTNIYKLNYKEIVYPRGANAGLTTARGRPEYAEVAIGSLFGNTFSASLSVGSNGIDRGPLERRTFWRDSNILRTRRAGVVQFSNATVGVALDPSWYITGTIPNSQGIINGHSTGIYPFGTIPLSYSLGAQQTGLQLCTQVAGVAFGTPDQYPNTGELNSANYQIFAGYAGTSRDSANPSGVSSSISAHCVWYPTASAFYYHFPRIAGAQGSNGPYMIGMKWRTAELSGKKPWFDSYEDYAADIRGLGKSFTVVPEFRISDHIKYYIVTKAKDFKAKNDKFLSLNGASITSSANDRDSSPNDDIRGFSDKFFNDYSNSDFQQYFGKFDTDSDDNLTNLTLRCKGIKKLLPYNGFYPSQRSLQLASLFSQSIAPYVDGIQWKRGQTIDPDHPPSGALAVQSLLQPFYAPGIMYNTIKSGIGVTWGAYTGSIPVGTGIYGAATVGTLRLKSNYKIPFESILDPLGKTGIPNQSGSETATQKLYLAIPTYQTGSRNDYAISGAAFPWAPVCCPESPTARQARAPYVELTGSSRTLAQSNNSDYGVYQLAISNFLAEIPNFFLNNSEDPGKFKKIESSFNVSQIRNRLQAGTRYYMDIYLDKSDDLVMMEEKSVFKAPGLPATRDVNGRLFGPPLATKENFLNFAETLCYTQYTPPYFFGRSKVTIEYLSTADDATNFTFGKFFNEVTSTYSNRTLTDRFQAYAGHGGLQSAAHSGTMTIDASINFEGVSRGIGGPNDTTTDAGLDKWVISPRMETPVLDFSGNLGTTAEDRPDGPIGMWSGYGELPVNKSINFGIDETYTNLSLVNAFGGQINSPTTGSLIDVMFDSQTQQKQVGEMAFSKEISEAIVAIPYVEAPDNNPNQATRTKDPILGKYFFSLGDNHIDSAKRFRAFWGNKRQFGEAIPDDQASVWGSGGPVVDTSISELGLMMDKYIFPPELDFRTNRFTFRSFVANTVTDPIPLVTGDFIEPFVMYVMEFNHTLKRQDLIDIWQGLMPEISTQAEQAISEASWPTGPLEFFGGKQIPANIRWMVFKVKKRANIDYYKATPSETDDSQTSTIIHEAELLGASYNWPYDYFSLVELAELEVEDEFLIYPETETEGT